MGIVLEYPEYYNKTCTSWSTTTPTKVVHTNSVHGKVVTHSGVATNSTCVSGAPCSHLNSKSSSDSRSVSEG